MATCTNWFWTKDQNGNTLPSNVRASIYLWKDSKWNLVGDAWIGPTSGDSLTLTADAKYKAVPITDFSGYITPTEQTWVACDNDITFVYKKIICTPGDTKCVGDAVHECSSDGTKWRFSKNCPGGCSGGECIEVPIANGFTIRVSDALATKTVLVAHVVKMPFIGLVGPDPDLWYWPQAFDYVGGKWYMTDPATKYRVEVGSIFETIPSFDKTYGTGSFADGIHCVVLAEGEGGVGTLIFKGSDVFQLFKDSPTEIYLSSTSTDVLTEAIMGPVCDFFKIPRGSACTSFWAEFYDPVYVANYVSIMRTGKDTLGNARELSGFDHIALPFAVLGSLPGLSLLPFGALVTKGLGAVSKAGVKFGDEAVQFMLNFSMDASNMVSSKDTWYFLDAIGQVTEDHATEIVNALTAGDTSLANTLLRRYAGESKGWWDYHKLNDLLKDALPTDAYNWLRTQIGLTEIGAGITTKIAKQTTLSADDVAKLASAAEDSEVLIESAEITSKLAKRVVLMAEMGQMDDAWEGALALSMICKNEPEIVRVMTPSQIEDLRKGLLEGFDEAEVDKFINDALRPAGRLVTEYYPKLVKFLGGVGDITKPDIENIFTLGSDSPEDVLSILDEFSAIDRRNLITKLHDGTYRQTLGNMFDLTLSQQSFVPFNKLDGVISSNCRIGLKALDSVDPAKMADIPHAAQEIAAKQGDIIDDAVAANPKVSKVRAEDIIFGLGRKSTDEIVDTAQEFADDVPTNWFTKARQRASVIPARIKSTWTGLERYEKVLVVWFMVDNMAFMVYMMAKFLGLGPGDRGFDAWNLAKSVTDASWLCKSSCEDKRYGDLSNDIEILEGAIINLEDFLNDHEFALKLENNYAAPYTVLDVGKSSLKLYQECLVNGGVEVAPSTGTIVFFCEDEKGQPVTCGAYVENRKVGTVWGSGLSIDEVNPGTYDLKMYATGYTDCTDTVTVSAGSYDEFKCVMTQIGDCSPVTDVKIYIDPLSPAKDQTVSFNGSAKSNDPITKWEWDFGDDFTATGQAVTHTYRSVGIYTVVLKVTNDCENSESTIRNVTVSEEAPPVESTTLAIETPIGVDGKEIDRYWEIEIWVDGKDTACNPPKTLTFGTSVFCDCTSPWNLVPCELGQHTITLKKYGYDEKSISVYLRKDEPKTWSSPVMVKSVAPLPERTIDIIVPAGSALYVDGKSIGGTTTVGRLTTIFNDLRKR
jgi:PKD repeat protein